MMMSKTLYHDGHFFFSPSASLLSLATNQIGFVTRSILREKNVYIWPSIHWWIAPIVSTISAIWTPRCQRLAWHVVCKLLKRVRTSSLPSLIGSLRYSPKLAVNKYQLLSIYSFSYVPSLVDSSWKGNIVFCSVCTILPFHIKDTQEGFWRQRVFWFVQPWEQKLLKLGVTEPILI